MNNQPSTYSDKIAPSTSNYSSSFTNVNYGGYSFTSTYNNNRTK